MTVTGLAKTPGHVECTWWSPQEGRYWDQHFAEAGLVPASSKGPTFEQWSEAQMADPKFAKGYQKAKTHIDAIDQLVRSFDNGAPTHIVAWIGDHHMINLWASKRDAQALVAHLEKVGRALTAYIKPAGSAPKGDAT